MDRRRSRPSADLLAAGGSVGLSLNGVLLESTDGGKTWRQSSLRGHGYVFGIDVLPDGSAGYAVTCPIGGLAGCGLWRYDPARA